MRAKVNGAYRRVLHDVLEREIREKSPPGLDEVKAYYDAHRDQFVRGERIQIWRIVVDDQALAKRIIDEAKGPGGPERWKALAREHSLDAATKMRGGALGFVYADGHTEAPQVRVDAALFDAARKVKDGEIVSEPVPEGKHFSVVWRRGSISAVERPIEQERPAIEQVLLRQRVKKAFDNLLERLTKQNVHEIHPELLDALPKTETRTSAKRGSGQPSAPRGSAAPTPQPGPAGNR